jgi:hypothetical protein
MADDSVIVKFGGSIENLTAAVDSARGSIESLASPFTGLTSAAAGFGEAFAGAFAVHEIKGFAESMAQLGIETSRASQILGVSTEEIGVLDHIAKASGGSLEELQTAFGRLSRNIIDESPNAKRALDALGLSFADIRNKTPEAQLELLATKFAGIKDGADKDAIAIALLGRAGQNLIPIFNQGAEGFKRLADEARELDPDFARAAVAGLELHDALDGMNKAIDGASHEGLVNLKAALVGAVQGVRDLASWFTNSVRDGGAMADALQVLSSALHGLVAALAVTTAAVKEMWAAFSYGADVAGMAINEVIEQVGNLGSALLHLDFSGVKNEWKLFGDQIKQRTDAYTKDVSSANEQMFNELQTIFQSGDKKIEAEHAQHQARMAAAGGGAKTNTDALEAAKKEIDGEMKALQEGLALKKTVWDGEVAAHNMSKEQEYASLMQATQKEYQGEVALLEKEKALQGQKPAAIQEINNKIEALQAAHNLKMVKLDQDSLAEETASWQRFADTLTTTFNSQLKGLITGTTTFNKAFKSMATDMLVKFIEVVENMVVKWAVGQLAQTTATVTGAQARAAAQSASSVTSDAGTIASVMRSISASAAETFGGVFGFLSPVLGPAAAGPAAGAEATVLAAGGAIGALAVGAWSLPSDMLAMVHRGEMVVPAGVTPWAQGLISGAANTPGVSTVHVNHATNFHVSAMDSRGVKQFFNDHGRTIMRTVNESVRTGSHIGLSKLART